MTTLKQLAASASEDTVILEDLNPADYAVVDLDTGTMLGTNLRVVYTGNLTQEDEEDLMSNDSEAVDYAAKNGDTLRVLADYVEKHEDDDIDDETVEAAENAINELMKLGRKNKK